MLTPFEFLYLLCSPLSPPLYHHVRRKLRQALDSGLDRAAVLDVGGRKSHYTIGLPARITVTDLPRVSEIQRRLSLGTNDRINELTRSRRYDQDVAAGKQLRCRDCSRGLGACGAG